MPTAFKFCALLRLVKIEHSVFALPFAYIGLFIAAGGRPGWRAFVLVTLAMVAVRSFAMTVNRLADLNHDRTNPRTRDRPLVTGEISVRQAGLFCAGSGLVFVAACAGLNTTCLVLSPAALALAAGYSFSKRFTWLCHFWLGAVLGLAPLGGWLAVDPALSLPPALFFLGVLFWVAGFDILYACQDEAFDKEHGLCSAPAALGVPTAMRLSSFCHVNAALFFLLAGWGASLSWGYYPVWAAVALALAWEHRLVSPDNLSRINAAFFTVNGVVAMALFPGVLLGLYL